MFFASPYFDPARDWREIAIRAHRILCQMSDEEAIAAGAEDDLQFGDLTDRDPIDLKTRRAA